MSSPEDGLNWIWQLSVKAYIQLLIGLEEKIREYLLDLQLALSH
jgi:hypothetical protein